jgi:hypothetical protein
MPPKSEQKATAPADAKAVVTSNSTDNARLVHSAALTASVERAILSMLPFHELHTLARLCKNMRCVVVAHAELRHLLDWPDDGEVCYPSVVALASRCRQLRTVSMRDLTSGQLTMEQPLLELLPKLVALNSASLRDVSVDALLASPALLEALSRCPRLSHFHDMGSTGFVGNQKGYLAAVKRIVDCCPEVCSTDCLLREAACFAVLLLLGPSPLLHSGWLALNASCLSFDV